MTGQLVYCEFALRLNHAHIEKSVLKVSSRTCQFLSIGRTCQVQASIDIEHGVELVSATRFYVLLMRYRVLNLQEHSRFAMKVPGVFIRNIDCPRFIELEVIHGVFWSWHLCVNTPLWNLVNSRLLTNESLVLLFFHLFDFLMLYFISFHIDSIVIYVVGSIFLIFLRVCLAINLIQSSALTKKRFPLLSDESFTSILINLQWYPCIFCFFLLLRSHLIENDQIILWGLLLIYRQYSSGHFGFLLIMVSSSDHVLLIFIDTLICKLQRTPTTRFYELLNDIDRVLIRAKCSMRCHHERLTGFQMCQI